MTIRRRPAVGRSTRLTVRRSVLATVTTGLGLVAIAVPATATPAIPAPDSAFVCPNPPAGCGSGNHNQVRL